MAATSERLEDVFQEEIIKAFVNMSEFKKFARSSNGLRLDEYEIKTIVENHSDSVEDQKMELLFKWREKHCENATAVKIRSLVTGYQRGRPADYISLCKGLFGVFKNRPLNERARVYLGEQRSRITDARLRAIKLVEHGEGTLREAKILTKLEGHENVVRMIHADEFRGEFFNYIFIVMELSWTEHMRDVLEECKLSQTPLVECTAMNAALQILKGLVFIHEHDVIHRDLKCENILVSENRKRIKLTDFGISKIITQGAYTKNTSFEIGTDGYRAAETYESDTISQKSDLFSAGIALAEIFSSGKHPYGDDRDLWAYNIKKNKAPDLNQLRIGNYRNSVQKLLGKMLRHEAEMRPSAIEVLTEFQDILEGKHDAVSDQSPEDNQQVEAEDQPEVQLSVYSIQEENLQSAATEKANAIIVSNRQDNHMYSYKPSEPTAGWSKMQKIAGVLFSTVFLYQHIYSLHDKEVQRLKVSDASAEWTRVANLRKDHGPDPPATICHGSIHACGSSKEPSRSVERYEELLNAWITLPDLNEARNRPSVVGTESHLYCIGGRDDDKGLRTVERFDGVKWEYVEDAPRELYGACATLLGEKIYVVDRRGVLCYNILNNSWSTLKFSDEWPFETPYLKMLNVDDKLYIVGPTIYLGYDYSEIYFLDTEAETVTRIKQIKEKRLYVHSTVAVCLE